MISQTLLVYPAIEQSMGCLIDWLLVGKGEKTNDSCGSVVGVKACEHHKEDYRLLHYRCFRPDCPVCNSAWSNREGERASERLINGSKVYKGMGVCKHIVLSPPQDYAIGLLKTVVGYKSLRNKAVKLSKKYGFRGGCMIFHPFRREGLVWCLSPHFHLVGYGYFINSDVFYEETGWVYKNKGKRKSIFGTVSYLLSHSGLGFVSGVRRFHSLTWFGVLSYNKIMVIEERVEEEHEKCVICDGLLHKYVPCFYGRDFYDDNGDWFHNDFRSWVDVGLYSHRRVVRKYALIVRGADYG